MLTRFHIKGFKSLADVEVALEPLTALVGPNATRDNHKADGRNRP